ncbi:MAG TPA: hypothetical protein VES20_21365 [Bryobacteraceae bacterium]|nr:hypothetical protein [Bryobacteraceae bacterium]
MRLLCYLLFVLSVSTFAADKPVPPAQAGNDAIDLKGSVASGREAAGLLLGIDPGHDMIVVSVEAITKEDGTKVVISRDDFTLLSRRDGQRSQALHPAQIAGSGTMMVTSRGPGAAGGMMNPNRGPIWGGMPGTGTRPQRIGGDDVVSGAEPAETKSTVKNDTEKAENPLLGALRARELPEGAVNESVKGLLYFVLEGKHKPKDLELMYKGAGGTLMLDFVK